MIIRCFNNAKMTQLDELQEMRVNYRHRPGFLKAISGNTASPLFELVVKAVLVLTRGNAGLIC